MMAEQEAEEEQNQAECFRVLQLCRPPYGEGAMCDLFFDSPCHQYDYLDTKLSKNRAALHNLDCEEKRKACLGGGAQDFCRPYWAYCADYDHERRVDPTWRGHIKLPQPPENISEMKLPDDFLPCNKGLAKTVFLFDKKNHFLAVGQILQSNVLNINNDVRGLRRFGRIKDDHGDIKADKELKLEDRIFLKQVHGIGVLKKNNYVQQCGLAKPFWIFKDGGWNIGYFDQKKQELLRDNLGNRAPDKLVHVSIH
ncbi:hypothetical protein RF55_24127 [Lasius niger]|uniref:Uncharacterized protein n=1 Tax=Lasius niger TaxID=67767 RepID=A0A0J7JV64_LASNI|nr:hypothetical protein RF55_24127 [Lasius niger]